MPQIFTVLDNPLGSFLNVGTNKSQDEENESYVTCDMLSQITVQRSAHVRPPVRSPSVAGAPRRDKMAHDLCKLDEHCIVKDVP